MAEQSLKQKCYISIATIKRAELNHPVSLQTLKKLSIFFNVNTDVLIEENNITKLKESGTWKKTTINWNLIERLSDSNQHKKLSNICLELYSLLNTYDEDENIKKIFRHG